MFCTPRALDPCVLAGTALPLLPRAGSQMCTLELLVIAVVAPELIAVSGEGVGQHHAATG